jgi:hypothetical protein
MLKTSSISAAVTMALFWFASNTVFADSVHPIGPRKTAADDVGGVYEYIYEHNTKDLTENHYIVLNLENETVAGLYYGTSDDFDDAREGYLPGFFVSPMRELSIQNHTISFKIELQPDDLFVKPIGLSTKSPREVDQKQNRRWIADYQPGLRLTRNLVIYAGAIKNNEIRIVTKYGTRIFKKIK